MTDIEATLSTPLDHRSARLAPFEALAQTNRQLTQEAREFIESFRFDIDESPDSTSWILLNRVTTPAQTYTTLGRTAMITGTLDSDSYPQRAVETRIYRVAGIDDDELEDVLAIRSDPQKLYKLKPENLVDDERTYFSTRSGSLDREDEIIKWAEAHAPNRAFAPINGLHREIQRAKIGRNLGNFDDYLQRLKVAANDPKRNPQLGA